MNVPEARRRLHESDSYFRFAIFSAAQISDSGQDFLGGLRVRQEEFLFHGNSCGKKNQPAMSIDH